MASALLLPTEPLLAPFRTLQRAILGVGVAGILLALWLGLRSARSVTAPLQALASAAGALAEGHMPDSLPVVPSPDEVGVLNRAFRSMLAELRAKDELLGLLASAGAAPGPSTASVVPPEVEETRALVVPARDDDEPLPPQLRVGGVFANRYRVDGVLGRGGMGVVLKVWDLQLEEDVALKVVRAALAADPGFLDQLKQEIRLARRITHRFVMRTHDFGESGGIPFVTMEFLKGVTLQGLMDGRGRLPLPLVLRIARQVAEGLEAAHAAQVVHRDIKPMNVLFDVRGDAKIMDFGLAAPARGGLAQGGLTVGTPRYMAPEQIRGERVDARSDLYALGVMLFELCSGAPPYGEARVPDLLGQHLEAPIPSLAATCPEAPEELVALVGRLMAKRREDRPQSAAEVVEILKIISAGANASLERTGR
jgi:serine/threonine-protein kinase